MAERARAQDAAEEDKDRSHKRLERMESSQRLREEKEKKASGSKHIEDLKDSSSNRRGLERMESSQRLRDERDRHLAKSQGTGLKKEKEEGHGDHKEHGSKLHRQETKRVPREERDKDEKDDKDKKEKKDKVRQRYASLFECYHCEALEFSAGMRINVWILCMPMRSSPPRASRAARSSRPRRRATARRWASRSRPIRRTYGACARLCSDSLRRCRTPTRASRVRVASCVARRVVSSSCVAGSVALESVRSHSRF